METVSMDCHFELHTATRTCAEGAYLPTHSTFEPLPKICELLVSATMLVVASYRRPNCEASSLYLWACIQLNVGRHDSRWQSRDWHLRRMYLLAAAACANAWDVIPLETGRLHHVYRSKDN